MKYYVSVDVGGTKVLAGAATEDGEVLARSKEKSERTSKKKLLEQIERVIGDAIEGAKLSPSQIFGIALGVPGVVDSQTGYVVSTPNVPLTDTNLSERLAQTFGAPVIVGNDANVGTVGEFWHGAAKDAGSAYGIFVGTGIGGALIFDGKLIEGYRGLCGEIGNLMIPLDADEISGMLTKKHTRLEELCSRTAIENQLRHAILNEGRKSDLIEITGDKKLERIRSKSLKEALRRKDEVVMDVMRRASLLLGLTTASVLHIVDPEVIVFGGGVIEACGDFMLPLIEKTAQKVAMAGNGKPLKIVRSSLGDDALILGGVAQLRERNFPERTATNGTANRARAQVDKPLPGV